MVEPVFDPVDGIAGRDLRVNDVVQVIRNPAANLKVNGQITSISVKDRKHVTVNLELADGMSATMEVPKISMVKAEQVTVLEERAATFDKLTYIIVIALIIIFIIAVGAVMFL